MEGTSGERSLVGCVMLNTPAFVAETIDPTRRLRSFLRPTSKAPADIAGSACPVPAPVARHHLVDALIFDQEDRTRAYRTVPASLKSSSEPTPATSSIGCSRTLAVPLRTFRHGPFSPRHADPPTKGTGR